MRKLSLLMAIIMIVASLGTVAFADEAVELRVAAGYQKTNEAISFQDASVTGEGITLADGKTYYTGDLKPTWQFLSEKLGITFVDKFTGAGSAEKEFKVWENNLGEVDIVAGSLSVLSAAGAEGKLVDLAQYLDQMPSFKAYLEANAIVRLSITGDTKSGAIFFSPYFDGVDDIERMPLMRADFVEYLLDSEDFAGADRALADAVYQPYMPTSGKVTVASLNADGTAVVDIVKDYDANGNIVAMMNDAIANGGLTGNQAVTMFRDYIDAMYDYAKRSDLFLGYDACWDADEMAALLRCAVASLNDDDGNPIAGLYSRETSNNQRQVDLFRFAGTLFGVRGMESRQDYLYFDAEGNLHDARQEAAAYEAVEKMNALYKEGLIIMTGEASSTNYLEKDAGLMSYDYNQTQTVMNGTKLNQNGDEGEKYIAVMVPVAKWYDGTSEDGVFMRFTESWRSVKTDGWAISVAGINGNEAKLNAALKLIDFAFSVQGQITMSYGPDAFIKVKDASVEVVTWEDVEKKYETFAFNGQQMPIVADETYASLQALTSGNYTNFARRYLGSTLNGFPKSQAFEYQCTHEIGKEGSKILATAIGMGTIKHPLLAVNTENMWYTSVPTNLPTTQAENNTIKEFTELGSSGQYSSSKGGFNLLVDVISNGYASISEDATAETVAAKVADEWNGAQYLNIKQRAWKKLLSFYTK